MPDRVGGHRPLLHQLPAGKTQRDEPAGDGSCTSTAVPLEHVTIHRNGMLSQLGQIHRSPQRPAHQALNFRAAGGELQLGDIPLAALPVGPGQHGILRRHPAGTLRHMGWGALLHTGAAEHHRVAALDQAASLREFHKVCSDLDGSQLVKGPAVLSHHVARSFLSVILLVQNAAAATMFSATGFPGMPAPALPRHFPAPRRR